jgi:hypothetical protein
MSVVLYDTKNYEVSVADTQELVMAEDGKYANIPGYIVTNKETGIVEHTTMMLPQAIYQAQGLSDSLDTLLAADKTPDNLVQMVTDDVVPH